MLRRVLAAVVAICGSVPVVAQHATAFDVENGARAYQGACAGCHGPDGNLIAGIDFGRGAFRRPLTDAEIVGIIKSGIANTPMPPSPAMSDAQAAQIVAYLRSLPQTGSEAVSGGDVSRGRDIVLGAGKCLDCHRVGAVGSTLGTNLSRIGLDRRAVELTRALVDPDAEVQPEQRFYLVTPKRGDPVKGRLLNQDTFTVQIMDERGELRSFDKASLARFGFTASPMPSYRGTLDERALADVVSYLVTLRGSSAP